MNQERRRQHWSLMIIGVGLSALSGRTAVAAPPGAEPATAMTPAKAPKVEVTVAADRAAVAAGDTFHLVTTLEIEEGAHVYWRSPGGTGLPTEIIWSGPAGFRFGRTQFPAPEAEHDEVLKETSWIHAGTVQFITPVKAPDTLDVGGDVTFRLTAKWLTCRKGICVPGGAKKQLSLRTAAAPQPANEDLLETARFALPVPAAKAEHARISVAVDKRTVKPGASFTATVTAKIAAKHHMQSHKPLEDYLIPAVVFVEPITDAEVGAVEYPEAHIRNDPLLGKMSEYSGKTEFKIPVKLEKTEDKSPRWVRGVLQYQICSDAGTCFPPQYVEFHAPVRIEGGPAPAATPDEFVERVASATVEDASGGGTPDANDGEIAVAGGDGNGSENDPTTAAAVDDGTTWIGRSQEWLLSFGYAGALILALIGGIVLNLMPCVLPVVSLKILSYVRQANEDRGRVFALGLSYCAGIMVFFAIISTLYYTTGQAWGEHFQNPYVVLILAAIIMAFALSLFGVFAVFSPKFVNELGAKAEEREGLPSAFLTGVLATILGTACTGPFMSVALGAANDFSEFRGAMIFMAVGFGMMLPFLILSANPAWLKYVPKPGRWMGVFEAVMGFLLLGTVIWIINPIRSQLGAYGLLLSLMFLLGVGIAVWLRGKAQFTTNAGYKMPLNLVAIAMVAIAWLLPFRAFATVDGLLAAKEKSEKYEKDGRWLERIGGLDGAPGILPLPDYSMGEVDWFNYDKELVRRYVEAGYNVFVDFTADWCPTCKVNLKTSIDIEQTRNLMRDLQVIPFKGDYSRRSPEMKKIINSYGRPSVPTYVVFAPFEPDVPHVLDDVLTPGSLAAALKAAGPSRPEERVASRSAKPADAAGSPSNAP